MESTFVSDISVERDGSIYISRPITSLGKIWCSMYHSSSLRSFLIPVSVINDYKNEVAKHGLTIEIEE